MSTSRDNAELAPATTKRQVYSPFEPYWDAFLEWWKRDRQRSQSRHLTDSELMDVGLTRGAIDHAEQNRDMDVPRP